jgi:hypothetical protein
LTSRTTLTQCSGQHYFGVHSCFWFVTRSTTDKSELSEAATLPLLEAPGSSTPRYYFNVRDGLPIINDHIGVELADLPAAIEEGRREAALVASALRNQPGLVKEMAVQICDQDGKIL